MLLFIILQALDFITTVTGFRLGAGEASPFVRLLMHAGPEVGVGISKLIALVLAGICVKFGYGRVLRWANFWYSGLFFWNVFVVLTALQRAS